jgi:hypothetical protein
MAAVKKKTLFTLGAGAVGAAMGVGLAFAMQHLGAT